MKSNLDPIKVKNADELLAVFIKSNLKKEEILSQTVTLLNPQARLIYNPFAHWQPHYAAARLCWDLSENLQGSVDSFWHTKNSHIDNVKRLFEEHSYGSKISKSLSSTLSKIRSSQEKTQKVWIPLESHLTSASEDQAYCLGFELDVIEKQLDMQVVFRSQSLLGVCTYDLFLFSAYHELIANQLGLNLGRLHWTLLSAYIHEDEKETAHKVLEWWENIGKDIPLQKQKLAVILNAAALIYPGHEIGLREKYNQINIKSWKNDPIFNMMYEYAKLQHTYVPQQKEITV